MEGALLNKRERRWIQDVRTQQALERVAQELSCLSTLFHQAHLEGHNGIDIGRAVASSFASLATQVDHIQTAIKTRVF